MHLCTPPHHHHHHHHSFSSPLCSALLPSSILLSPRACPLFHSPLPLPPSSPHTNIRSVIVPKRRFASPLYPSSCCQCQFSFGARCSPRWGLSKTGNQEIRPDHIWAASVLDQNFTNQNPSLHPVNPRPWVDHARRSSVCGFGPLDPPRASRLSPPPLPTLTPLEGAWWACRQRHIPMRHAIAPL